MHEGASRMHLPAAEFCTAFKPADLGPSEGRHHAPPILSRTVLLDQQGAVVAADTSWFDLAAKTGDPLHTISLGRNYLQACREAARTSDSARAALFGITTVLKGEKPSFTMDYRCGSDSAVYFFRMNVMPFAFQNARAAITHVEISDLHSSDTKRVRQFARALIKAQEEERKKISQEIHDDFGSRIALIGFSLRQAIKQSPKKSRAPITELQNILANVIELSSGLRDISHSLYPPSLRYIGIDAALKTLAETFEQTHRIKVQVTVPKEMSRLPDEVELCIFRISQECLHNTVK